MTVPIEERMEKAMRFFAEQAGLAKKDDQREMFEHLHEVAAVNQLNTRMLDVLKHELEEVRHELGSH